MGKTGIRAMWALVSGCALALVGCGSTQLTPTGASQPPREANCEFRMLTTAPAEGYTEVGAIDVQPGGYATNTYTDLAAFKEEIRPYVCQAGGDAAIGYANGYGMYIKATVLKSVAVRARPEPEVAEKAAPPPSAPAAPVAPAERPSLRHAMQG